MLFDQSVELIFFSLDADRARDAGAAVATVPGLHVRLSIMDHSLLYHLLVLHLAPDESALRLLGVELQPLWVLLIFFLLRELRLACNSACKELVLLQILEVGVVLNVLAALAVVCVREKHWWESCCREHCVQHTKIVSFEQSRIDCPCCLELRQKLLSRVAPSWTLKQLALCLFDYYRFIKDTGLLELLKGL